MRNLKLTISYDGSSFLGWQKNRLGPTIEGELERAAEQILREKIQLQACSRTDAGVHALGQVVNLVTSRSEMPLRKIQHGLNALLPKEIRVIQIEEVPSHFHPTLDALAKTYHYHLCLGPSQLPFYRHFSWHCPYPLNLDAMRTAALHFIGEHDFSAFCNQRKDLRYQDTIRRITRLEIIQLPEERLRIEVNGNSFLYKMVRTIAGTLVYVGQGKILPEEISSILAGKARQLAGVTAPSYGLTLVEIHYKMDAII